MTLSEISIRRPVFTTMVTLGLLALGYIGYTRLGTDLYPDVSMPFVTIAVPYPGAAPEAVEREILEPIEDAVVAINGVDRVNAFARDNVGFVAVIFKMSVDFDQAANDVREKLDAVTARLPSAAQKPIMSRADIGAAPILIYAASAPLPSDEVRRLTEDVIKPALERVEGVAKVDVVGGREREIQVELDALALESYRLSPFQVYQKIQAENATIPAGHYFTGGAGSAGDAYEVGVRTIGEVNSVRDIEEILIHASADGRQIRVKDVARVVDGFAEQRTLIRANGHDAVAFQVVKTSGGNTVKVADEVKRVLAALPMPSGLEARLLIDQSTFIKENAHEVEIAIVFGGAMAILIILLFMMDLRSTFISALALPTAVIGTFLMMYALGFTLNMLTLLGLSLAIGLLIDDAVVVRENIFRHLEMGETPMVAAEKGTREITLAVLATTMTIVAVFVPVAFMEGIVGQFFRQFGLTVTAAVLLSMWVAFTLDPMLSARLARSVDREEESRHKGLSGFVKRHLGAVFAANDRAYGRLLGWTVRHPFAVFGLAIGLLVGSFALAARIGMDFMSPEDRGQFIINVEFPPEMSLPETSRRSLEIEQRLLKDARFHTVYSTIGPDGEVNKARYRIDVGPKWLRPDGVEALKVVARELAAQAPDSTVTAENPPMIEGLGAWYPIMVSIGGPDYAVLEPTAQKVASILRSTAGAADVKVDHQPGKREMRVVPDRDLAARAGLPMALLGFNVRVAMEGEKAGKMRDKDPDGHDRETDIRVRLRAEDRASPDALAHIPLSSDAKDPMTPVVAGMPPPPPKVVRIGDVASVAEGIAPSRIVRDNRERRIVVSASAVGRPLGDLFADVKPRIDALTPPGYVIEYLGTVKDMQDSNESFGLAFGLAILFIYLVLASQFESFLHPLTIMLSLPLALVGALLGLYLYGAPLSMGSQIGIILLMGLVTKNAILLIDSALVFQREGMTPRDAILAAGPRRLRPILMTSAAMVLGMLPTAMSNGSGSEFRAPMAIAVIGGVISSTMLTLIVVPTVYLGIEWLRGLFRRRAPAVPAGVVGTSTALLLALGAAAAFAPGAAQAARITLPEAYDAALKHNPDLALAAEQVRRAEVDVRRAWAYFLPQAKVQGSYTWYDEELEFEFALPPNLAALAGDIPPMKIQESPTFQWQGQVILPLVNLEGLAALKASRKGVEANEHIVTAARQEVLMAVAYVYHTIAALDRAAAAAAEGIVNAKETLRVAEAQRAAETATELGVVRAQAALAEAEALVIEIRSGREAACAGLTRLTGLTGDVEVDAVTPATTPPSGSLDTWLEEARGARAELRAVEAQVAAVEALDGGYWATYLPTIAGQATYWQTTNEGLTGQGDGANWGLVAEWKLYDGGLREATVRERESHVRSARLERERRLAALREEIARAAAEARSALAGLETARRYAALAEKGQKLAQAAYAAGTVTNLEVSEANALRMKAAAGLAQAEVKAALSALAFEKALGRGVGRSGMGPSGALDGP
jgi:hydrophobe/amphiphile efflux-1 (HAE1) family protein